MRRHRRDSAPGGTPALLALAAAALAAGCAGPFTKNPLFGGPIQLGGGLSRTTMGEGWAVIAGFPLDSARDVQVTYESLRDHDDWRNRVGLELAGLARENTWDAGWLWRLGWLAHWDEPGYWGTGPRADVGYCAYHMMGGRFGVEIMVGVYAWTGVRHEEPAGDIDFEMRVNAIIKLGRRPVW